MDAPPADATYRDEAAPVDRRVDDLLQRMTLPEKVAQLGSVRADQVLDDGDLDRDAAAELLAGGVGHLTRIGGEGGLSPTAAARVTNELQELLVEETRLGVPAIPHEECLSGYMGPQGTTFPQGIGLASTWDPALVGAVTDAIRRELRAIGTRHALSPVADVARDPRWGRTEETFGEDPYLAGAMVAAYVSGLQGDVARGSAGDAVPHGDGAVPHATPAGPSADGAEPGVEGVSATVKHFLGHGAGAGGKNRSAVDLAPGVLREVHGFPFEAAVRVAGVDAVMNAYHAIDGVPCATDEWLLTELLRGEWGFDGTVVSDYFSVDFLREEHGVAETDREAAVAALSAGVDVELPATDCYAALVEAVEDGALAEPVLDEAVRRVLRAKVRAGLLDDPYVDADAAAAAFDTAERAALAREAARRSIVLLDNDEDVLPLASRYGGPADGESAADGAAGLGSIADLDSVAVVGPKADSRTGMLGDYAYAAHYPEEEYEFDAATPLAAIERRLASNTDGPSATVTYARGCTTTGPSTEGLDEAAAAAADADVALAFVGARSAVDFSDPDEERAERPTVATSGEGRDVTDLSLPGVQPALLRRLGETETPLVVVVVSGKPHAIEWAAERADAVVQAWLPGEQGGHALADVLLDGREPGGRLPISIPRSVGQLPVHYDRKPNAAAESYVYDDGAPLYAFGHGESYGRVEYRDCSVSQASVAPADAVSVAVTVENVADRPASEVVQLYASAEAPSRTRPVQRLRGFQRVDLDAGEAATVSFDLSATQLAYRDRDRGLLVEEGPYELRVGRASDDIVARETIRVTDSATVPRHGRTYFAESAVER